MKYAIGSTGYKWKLPFLVAAIFVCCSGLFAQKMETLRYNPVAQNSASHLHPLKAGDLIKEEAISIFSSGPDKKNQVHKQKINFADLSGKVVVIEFWATWCGPCLPALTRLNHVQQKMGKEKLITIAVSMENKEDILRGISHMNVDHVFFSNDTGFMKRFEFRVIPHTIVIDKEGRIAAETFPDSVTITRLEALTAGNKVKFPLKKDAINVIDTAIDKPSAKDVFSVGITGYDPDAGTGVFKDSSANGITLNINNFTTPSLFREAYRMAAASWVIDRTHDPQISKFLPENLYCVKVHLPPFKSFTDAYRMAQNAINTAFKFKGRLVARRKKVYVLTYRPDTLAKQYVKFNEADNHDADLEFYGPNFKGSRITTAIVVDYLSNELGYTQNRLVVDGTGIDGNFDLVLKWEYAFPASLFAALKNYGLYLEEREMQVNMLLLK